MGREDIFDRTNLDDSSCLHEDGLVAHLTDKIVGVRSQHHDLGLAQEVLDAGLGLAGKTGIAGADPLTQPEYTLTSLPACPNTNQDQLKALFLTVHTHRTFQPGTMCPELASVRVR